MGKRPVVFVFAKSPSDDLASLAKQLDKVVAENKSQKMAAVINFTGERTDKFTAVVKKFAEDNKIKNIAVTTTSDGERFKVSDKADLTVMHYKGKRVKFNYAAKGELSKEDLAKILKGTETILE